MKKEYQKHIVSTDQYQVWLHRTTKKDITSILKEGLGTRGDFTGTANAQPTKLAEAEKWYKNAGKIYGPAVAVIKIPREMINEGYEGNCNITYWHPKNKNFYIQRQHIHGWIDRETDEYHPNPYLNEPQKLTNKHFPPTMYGGLEKDLVQEEKPAAKTKKTKPPKFKKGKLPPPPTEINILPY